MTTIAENRKRIKTLRQYAQAIADQLPSSYAHAVRVHKGVVTLRAACGNNGIVLRWSTKAQMTGTLYHSGATQPVENSTQLMLALCALTGHRHALIYTPAIFGYNGIGSSPARRAARLPVVEICATREELAELLDQNGVPKSALQQGFYRQARASWTFTPFKEEN